MDTLWQLLYLFTSLGSLSLLGLWFLIPKKWIVWSENAAKVLPSNTLPQWRTLNRNGRFIYIFSCVCFGLTFTILLIGYFLEKS